MQESAVPVWMYALALAVLLKSWLLFDTSKARVPAAAAGDTHMTIEALAKVPATRVATVPNLQNK
jgi:hypothetical protein